MLLQMAKSHPFWLNSILVYRYHIFFIHSSVDMQFACFHILATVTKAAMDIGVHLFFELMFLFSSAIHSGVDLMDHMEALFLVV